MKKNYFCFVALVCFAFNVYAQNSYYSDFYRGNLEEKNQVIINSIAEGDSSIAIEALDFSISAYNVLHADEDFITLTETSIKSLNAGNCVGKEKIVADKLRNIFKIFQESEIKVAILDAFSVFTSSENLLLVNDYFYSKMQNSDDVDEALLKSILFMGTYGNSTSFNMLFMADILDVWPSYNEILSTAYGELANESEKEIMQFLSTVPIEKKLVIVNRLCENPKISKKICGEAAENALSSVIYIEGAKKEFTDKQLELVLLCVKTIADSKWTRAASLATSSFTGIRAEYEKGNISDENYALIIRNIGSVSAPETAQVLSSYLDFLNKQTEKNQMPPKVVVLSVIETLGEMGDKSTFDCLLYATYLEYPKEVIVAAKDALAKLKW